MRPPGPPWPRPPRDGFPDRKVYPELAGQRLADVALRPMLGVGLHCRACGRHVAITPLGVRRLIASGRRWTVAQLVDRARCGTCGSAEIYATSEIFESDQLLPALLVRARAGGPRHDGRGAVSARGGVINPCPWL